MLILLAIFAMAYQFADLVILDHQFQEIQQLNNGMANDNAAIIRLNTELNTSQGVPRMTPTRNCVTRYRAARDEVALLQSRLKDATGELISPQDMARFLEQLSGTGKSAYDAPAADAGREAVAGRSADTKSSLPQQAVLHRHGFAIEFSGSYLATLNYLEALESLPWRFFWDSVSYEVLDYPKSIVRLKLHTLSLSEDWIGV